MGDDVRRGAPTPGYTAPMRVGILGGGRWGQALARLAAAAGSEPLIGYKDERPPHVLPSTPRPHEVAASCDLLVVATSAALVPEAMRLARPGPHNRVVVAGRGLEPATGRWLTEVVTESSEAVRVGALAGPAPVDEILAGGLGAGVVASPFADVRRQVVAAFHSPRYRVYEAEDLIGVQFAGAFVPVLATLVGLVRGLPGSGVGLHALVLSRGLEEGARCCRALGGDPATLGGLSGVGDLVAAQCADDHPHFQAGRRLARGERDGGPRAAAFALLARANRLGVEMPLLEALCAIWNGRDPLAALADLMGREAVPERR
jgi:glycerol-3-phosphate dehydrogenase (NAD(P)+)